MKKFYAGIAATAIAATGLVCSAGAAHADSAGWPSAYSIDPQDASVSLAVASDDATAYAAWVDQTDDATIDVATTTLATGDTTPVQQVSTEENVIIDAAATSTGKLVALGTLGGSPDILVFNVDGSGFHGITLDGLGSADQLAVSPNGQWAAVTGTDATTEAPAIALVNISSGTPTFSSQATLDGSTDIQDVKVSGSGSAWAVGDDDTGNWLWHMAGGTVDPTSLDASPESVAVLGDGTVAVGLDGTDDSESQLVYVNGDTVSAPVEIDGSVGNLTVSNQTLWANGNGDSSLTRIEGTSARTLNTTGYGQISDAAASSDGATLYVVGAAWLSDQETDGPTSLFAMTAPGAPTTLDTWANNDDIQVSWTAAAGTAGDDYRITLTDQASDDVVSTTEWSDNVIDGYASVDVPGADPTHHYSVTVEAFNGAFYSTPLTGQYLPTVPGQGTVTVTGAATVGTTLSSHLTSTWPSTATVGYQWLVSYSDGESGGLKAIPGATGTTFTVTPDLVGKYVALSVTAHQDTYTDAYAESDPLGPVAAASQPPVHVTKIKPATIKANAKKVKLNLPGIDVAKAPGKVKVYDGKKLVGTAKIVNGKLVVKFKKHLSHGKHKLKLNYKGSAQVAAFHKKVKIKVK